MNKKSLLIFLGLLAGGVLFAQSNNASPREHLLMDFGWRFAFGHPYDPAKDFNTGAGYFSYFAKAGYGDGAAAAGFDDRYWRKLNLPHDWAVEQPFSPKASFSHGFKAVGRAFPDASVGWYRKTFSIPSSDYGRRISIAFDGVFRNSIVWVNGHFLGNEPSGYAGFEYDLTDYLNYGGENVVAVRVDATMEEGWFYEGAGIYRHAWLNKTAPVHVATDGSFVTSKLSGNEAVVKAVVTLRNDDKTAGTFGLLQTIKDAAGTVVAQFAQADFSLKPFEEKEITASMFVKSPKLWDIETPHLYSLLTTVLQNGKTVDEYRTAFGVRTLKWDAAEGFFLNGKHLKIKGTNNHQDHAGVGTAMPDGLIDYRIKALKAMGSNAYRCSHNPPTPELLDACDRLGMLVIDENRLTGTADYHFNYLKRLIRRDRNHPSVISWSIGNEEWATENNVTGARIATTMQAFVKSLDTTRAVTYAFSGGLSNGISPAIELLGYNYVMNKNTDEHHKKYPAQWSWGTEEGSTVATRGEYVTNTEKHFRAAYDEPQTQGFLSLEQGWKWYAERPYLGGMFIWTGFDYRGEPTPFGWPSTTSLFGMMDLCGFPKDNVWYLKSWWTKEPILHILPHWNWRGKEGQEVPVWVYSNCGEVELFLNRKSLGRKPVPLNSHLEWKVAYVPGTIEAVGYNSNKKVLTETVQTTGDPAAIRLQASTKTINANGEDLAVITIDVTDKNNLHHPTAANEIRFTIEGPATLIGVGNGDPTSLEKDKFLSKIDVAKIEGLKEKFVSDMQNRTEAAADYNDAGWQTAFKDDRTKAFGDSVKAVVYRGSFTLPKLSGSQTVTLFYNSIGREQSVYVNGKEIGKDLRETKGGNAFVLPASLLREGQNSIAVAATPLLKKQPWDNVNTNPGLVQIITPAQQWKRSLFNGLAQVIVQAGFGEGDITIRAEGDGLKSASLIIKSVKAERRPALPE